MVPKDGQARDRTSLAEARTDWAEDRTILAAERTFAGWLRTGLTTVVVALGLQALFGVAEPVWLPKVVASVFLIAAFLTFVAAWSEARISRRGLEAHGCRVQPMWRLTLVSVLLATGTAGIGLVLWLL